MTFPTLRDFVRALDEAGELKRVRGRVSPVLEIAHAADLESKARCPALPSAGARRDDPRFHGHGGRALLFENVEGSDFPVLINAWGSYSRMEMALGCAGDGFEAIARRIGELVKPEPPRSLKEAVAKARQFLPLLRIPPRRMKGSGVSQEVVVTGDAVDLTRLPIIKSWPLDGDLAGVGYPADVNDHVPDLGRGAEWDRLYRGRYVTLAGIHTVHAEDRDNPKPPSHNIGMYRVQLLGKRRMAMHWHMHHDGARHWRSWKKLGERMPVAIVLGGESVMPYAATAPLPPGISELLLAGFLNGRGIPMVRGKTVPVWVPANAEMVIEGYVSAEAGLIGWEPGGGERRRDEETERRSGERDRYGLGPGAVFEGPFGDHTGFYSMPDRYPVLEVTAITHRRDAIYPTTVVGLPIQEDYFLGKATERIFLPLLKTLIHDVEDYDLPTFGAFHNCAAVKIAKAYPLQGRRVMHSVWGAGQMAWTKTIFVVDEDVDVHDTMAVLRAAGERCDPGRDVETVNGPLDILDHAAPRLGAGMKIGFDATRKRLGEEVNGVAVEGTDSAPRRGGTEREVEERVVALGIEGVREARVVPDGSGAWLLVRVEKTRAGVGAEICRRVMEGLGTGSGERSGEGCGVRFVIVVSDVGSLEDVDAALFHWCAHCDASRDLVVLRDQGGRVRVMGFDATVKIAGDERNGQPVRRWPPILVRDGAAEGRARGLLQ